MAVNSVGEYNREGKEILTGTVDLDGTNPTPVDTGFSTIDHVHVALTGDTAPGVSTTTFSWEADGNTVNIYAWKPTGSGNTTLVASDGTETVSYVIIGRRRQ